MLTAPSGIKINKFTDKTPKSSQICIGLSITGEYLQDGVVFSWPTYENGLIIAVNNEQKGASMWAFSQAFTWQVWVAVVCTAILIGIIIFAVDAWMYGAQYDRTKNKIFAGTDEGSLKRIAFMDYIWEAVMRPMQVRDQRPLSFPSNFIVLAFSFMMLVIVTVYTANTTANITTTRLQSTIRGAQDLPGKAVGSWSDYKSELSKYGVILTSSLPWENEADEGAMIESLVNGTVQAFVLDESFLVYKAASSCEIAIIGNKFEELNQAVAFPRGFNNTALLDAVNQALIKLREEGVISLLRDIYVNPPEASCKTALIGDSTQISMSMLSGLWIVLAVAIGIALAIAVIYKIHVRYTQKHVDKFGLQMTKKFRLSGNLFKEHEVVV